MIRYAILAAAACLSACAEPPPAPTVDGETINRAVQHAQAQVDTGRSDQNISVAAVAREFGR